MRTWFILIYARQLHPCFLATLGVELTRSPLFNTTTAGDTVGDPLGEPCSTTSLASGLDMDRIHHIRIGWMNTTNQLLNELAVTCGGSFQ